jgi:phage FluMu protein gp41
MSISEVTHTEEVETTEEAPQATELTVITDAAGLTLHNVETQMAAFKADAATQIAQINAEYMELKADIKDPAGCEKIITGHKAVKKAKADFEKKRKFYKTPINVMAKTIDGTARWCSDELDAVEAHLAGERKIIDAEKLRIKEEKQRKAEAQLQDRVEKMTAVNGPIDVLQLRVMSPAKFAETLAAATTAHEKATAEEANRDKAKDTMQQLALYDQFATIEELLKLSDEDQKLLVTDAKFIHEKAEADRKAKEEEERKQDEADRLEREERERQQQAELDKLKAEAEERDRKEQERLKVEEAERAETQKIRDAEQAELQKLRDEAAERDRKELERLQKEQEAEQALADVEAEKLRQEEAEAAKAKQEEEDAKAAKKKARANKKRQDELQPQIDFLNNFGTGLDNLLGHDDFYLDETHELYEPVRAILETAARGVMALADDLS